MAEHILFRVTGRFETADGVDEEALSDIMSAIHLDFWDHVAELGERLDLQVDAFVEVEDEKPGGRKIPTQGPSS